MTERVDAVVAATFHEEWGRIVATLIGLTGDWDLAEECAQDAFTRALEVWTRDGIDRKTRSLVNVGMLTAMNRQHELAAHVRGAVNNGCSAIEIREVLLQAAIYCGLPAALDAFRTAEKALDETARG